MAVSDFRVLNGLTVEDASGAQARFTHYAGTPEGNVTAPIGSICTDNTTGKVYRKATGVSSSGWTELAGDEALQIFDWKTPVRCVLTTDHALANLFEIDGVTPIAGDRIGVVAQDPATENGIYLAVDSGPWTRATDANADAEVNAGLAFAVVGGTVYKGSVWVLTTAGTVDVDDTALEFTQVNPIYSAATNGGITVSSHQISISGFLRDSGTLVNATPKLLDTAPYEAVVWKVFAKTAASASVYSAVIHAVNAGDAGIDFNVSSILRLGIFSLGTITVARDGTAMTLTVTPNDAGTYVITREPVSLTAAPAPVI